MSEPRLRFRLNGAASAGSSMRCRRNATVIKEHEPVRSRSSLIRASPAVPCGAGCVRDMCVVLVESGIALAERERVRLGAGLEERDLQRSVADGIVLAHQLVHAVFAQYAVAVLVDVRAA
jgi:hypothetical protein